MGNSSHKLPRTLSPSELLTLQETTVFTKEQIESLYEHYKDLTEGEEFVSLDILKKGLQKNSITYDEKFIESMFYAFDTENKGKINLQQFLCGISIITKSNTDEEKMQLIFSMYDQEGRDVVSRSDLVNALHSMRRAFSGIRLDVDKGEPESADDLKGIVNYVNEVFSRIIEIRASDPTDPIHKGFMSYEDFKICIKYHPLVVEVGSVFLQETCKPVLATPNVESTLSKRRSSSFRRTYQRA